MVPITSGIWGATQSRGLPHSILIKVLVVISRVSRQKALVHSGMASISLALSLAVGARVRTVFAK